MNPQMDSERRGEGMNPQMSQMGKEEMSIQRWEGNRKLRIWDWRSVLFGRSTASSN
jgi:hypothetical protein